MHGHYVHVLPHDGVVCEAEGAAVHAATPAQILVVGAQGGQTSGGIEALVLAALQKGLDGYTLWPASCEGSYSTESHCPEGPHQALSCHLQPPVPGW